MKTPRLVGRSALLTLILATLGGGRESFAQEIDGASLVGKQVITRKGTVLTDSGQIVYDEGRGEFLKQGLDGRKFHIYRVRKSRDGEVWLSTKDVSAQGWTPIANVVPLEAAIAFIDEATSGKPDECEIHLARAQILQALGDPMKALDECAKAIRLAPPEERKKAYLARATLRAEGQNFDDAIEDCSEAIRIDPRFAPAHTIRGIVLTGKGDLARAFEDLNNAIESDPTLVQAYYNRGVVRMKRRELDLAFEDFNRAVQLDPASARDLCARGGCLARIIHTRSLSDAARAAGSV